MPKIKAVIFDLDGTLMDSREIIFGAFKHVLEKFSQGYDEEIISSHIGRSLDNIYSSLLPDHDFVELKKMHLGWQVQNKHLFKGFKGLGDFLDALKRTRLKIGLFTSSYWTRTEMALDVLEIRDFFDAIVCADDVKKPKPDKEGVVLAAKQLKTPLEGYCCGVSFFLKSSSDTLHLLNYSVVYGNVQTNQDFKCN